jgi:hypothetical protein
MAYILTSNDSFMNLSKSTCWISVLVIIGIIFIILIINDNNRQKLKHNNKTVKFNDDDEYDDEYEYKNVKSNNKSRCMI